MLQRIALVVAIECIEVGVTAQSLSGSNITVAGIEGGCDGTVSNPVRRDDLIDSGCFTKLSHQAINRATVQPMSLTAPIEAGE